MKLIRTRWGGFTLIEIMIVVAIIGLLAAIAVPNFVRAIREARQKACAANLRQIEGAKIAWALAERKAVTETPADADLFGPDKALPEKPSCPEGGIYHLNPVDTKAACSVPSHTF